MRAFSTSPPGYRKTDAQNRLPLYIRFHQLIHTASQAKQPLQPTRDLHFGSFP